MRLAEHPSCYRAPLEFVGEDRDAGEAVGGKEKIDVKIETVTDDVEFNLPIPAIRHAVAKRGIDGLRTDELLCLCTVDSPHRFHTTPEALLCRDALSEVLLQETVVAFRPDVPPEKRIANIPRGNSTVKINEQLQSHSIRTPTPPTGRRPG
jgi:hypothetical protein